MKHIFISYSHEDSEIADRLAADLRDAGLSATYDKWMLRVGDSILEKVASVVSESAFIIVLLSPWSVESKWVKKELSLAMASELSKGSVTVLPALLQHCTIPSMLADKLYADFQHNYFVGLYSLLEALSPETYQRDSVVWRYRHKASVEADHAELSSLLMNSDAFGLKEWFVKHNYALAALFRGYCFNVDVVPRFFINDTTEVDFVVVEIGSIVFISFLQLGAPMLIGKTKEDVKREINRLACLIEQWNAEAPKLQRLLALRMNRDTALGFIDYQDGYSEACTDRSAIAHRIHGILLLGRRTEYQGEWGVFRKWVCDAPRYGRSDSEPATPEEVKEVSDAPWYGRWSIEIASYDRILEGLRQAIGSSLPT
jgi:hypothetical protein